MSTVNTDAIKPRDTGLDITLGAAGDTTVISANSINTNTIEDSGGNTLFQSNGSGTLSNLNSAFVGSETLILSQTLSSYATFMIFVHGTDGVVFDTTYDYYIWRCYNLHPSAGGQAIGRYAWSSDGGSTWGYLSDLDTTSSAVWCSHKEDDTAATINYDTSYALYNSSDQKWGIGGTDADQAMCGEVLLWTPSSTTFRHIVMSDSESYMDGDLIVNLMINAYVRDGTASAIPDIDAVRFQFDSSDWIGTVKMYGVK